MAKASNRLLQKQRFSSARRKLPPYMSKGSFLIGRTLTGSPLTVVSAEKSSGVCTPSKKKPLTKDMCRSELIFAASGPKLRVCTVKGKVGPLVSVSSPSEATRIARDFCNCVKKTKNAKACAVKIGKGSPLGRYRR